MASPLLINVSDLLAERGRRREVVATVPASWAVELSRVAPDETVDVDLTLESAVGGIVVRGSAVAPIRHTCHRCLTEWDEALAVEITEVVEAAEDADYRLERDAIDLEPVVRDAVILDIPLLPTCREDCLGLCATCGADLNTGACPGHDDVREGPFAPLRELLEP